MEIRLFFVELAPLKTAQLEYSQISAEIRNVSKHKSLRAKKTLRSPLGPIEKRDDGGAMNYLTSRERPNSALYLRLKKLKSF